MGLPVARAGVIGAARINGRAVDHQLAGQLDHQHTGQVAGKLEGQGVQLVCPKR